ncbi:amino acid ABC transporter membrane protein 2, PAAT family [Microlunatus sagamiharensis]|uniref:Amino acid ABC transporter membrane protein 2, PAAT family n=1 Tax=Microlunatus sagamiharensis TaxID=546874 RepID=A0A1H2LY61_9ACTN|nr:amino acid ABC transporter permease [Microlunatus sagamiharensis]SDU85917.1 amino acid ABC transporter membrane protein 2, PAAT family [Microlunatus sagamiharensis]
MSVPAVLFDEPGPRARARHRVLGVVGALVILALLALVVRGLADPDNSQLTAEKWSPFLDGETWTAYLLPGLAATLKAAGAAVVLSGVLGVLLGLGRLSQARVVRGVCGALVEFLRSVPVLVMMLFVYYFCIFVLGVLGDTSTFVGVVGGLTLYNSAVIAELIRSGVFALPRGQREAGLAIGLTPRQTLVTVLLPQAVTAMLPSLISQLVVILKDTALGYIISYTDLLRSGTTLSSAYGNLIPTLIVVAIMFIVINYALSLVARLVERRLQTARRSPRPVDGAVPPGAVDAPTAVPDGTAVR